MQIRQPMCFAVGEWQFPITAMWPQDGQIAIAPRQNTRIASCRSMTEFAANGGLLRAINMNPLFQRLRFSSVALKRC